MENETTTQEVVKKETETQAQVAPELGKDGTPFDAARAQSLIDKLQEENKQFRASAKKLAELEAKEKERADAQLSTEQRLQKERDEALVKAETATKEANAKLLKSAVLLKAASMNFEHPEDAFALANLSAIQPDEKGDYDDKAIEAALKPLTGRLPVKTQGSGNGTPVLRPEKMNPVQNEKSMVKKFIRNY